MDSWEPSGKKNDSVENWEDMLNSDVEIENSREGAIAVDLDKLKIQQEEDDYNFEVACDLLGTPAATSTPRTTKVISSLQQKKTAGVIRSSNIAPSQSTYSLDSAKPRTAADYSLFSNAVLAKINLVKSDGTSALMTPFLEDLIHGLVQELPQPELKKLIGWTQTLYNKKSTASTSTSSVPGKSKKPILKFGGSLKSGFDHGLKEEADDDDYDRY